MKLPKGTIVYKVGVYDPSLHLIYQGRVIDPLPDVPDRCQIQWIGPESSILWKAKMTVWCDRVGKTPKQAINKYLRDVREDLEEQVNKHGWK